ncbi:3'-5' exonuclease [Actinospica sp. MGRD01-02]|uniref:3'-5' exonuclease n=1 Tax=Actinospica acidithermotolerans TaxID=2828514 RepID=A0A941IK68_9ACTN|nr:3'-5' exonuclease [Actinospica acidithermotolerans]MBR7827818.1 3'-5' exonuclease [Actinospica acidithermotolerans]
MIDFEALTPAGRPMEPVEVAALALRHTGGRWREQARFSALIRPPDDVPVTARFTTLTGITAAMLTGEPSARQVLGELDRRLSAPPYRLVAHNAATEGSLIRNQAEHCPNLASTPLIDTIAMARAVIPHLSSYKLDTVRAHYRIPPQPDRHRAMADVELTTEIFTRLLADGAKAGCWHDLPSLECAAGRAAPRRPAPRPRTPWEAEVPAQ